MRRACEPPTTKVAGFSLRSENFLLHRPRNLLTPQAYDSDSSCRTIFMQINLILLSLVVVYFLQHSHLFDESCHNDRKPILLWIITLLFCLHTHTLNKFAMMQTICLFYDTFYHTTSTYILSVCKIHPMLYTTKLAF